MGKTHPFFYAKYIAAVPIISSDRPQFSTAKLTLAAI
jgi:hypothetical protein